jgi:hypothetical protein
MVLQESQIMSIVASPATPGQLIGPPFIALVDLDGFAVPVGEKDIPHVEPDPTDPADWPPSADDWFWSTGPEIGLEPADSDAPDAARSCRFPGVMALPPISGGSPDAQPFEPSRSDWDDYSRWARDLESRYAAAEASRVPTPAEVRAWLDANEHTRPE